MGFEMVGSATRLEQFREDFPVYGQGVGVFGLCRKGDFHEVEAPCECTEP